MADEFPMTPELANRIYDILQECCGATDYWRQNFVQVQTSRYETEYRFCGSLGFGGKLYRERWPKPHCRVSCYREDETPERRAAIERVNEILKALAGDAGKETKGGDADG